MKKYLFTILFVLIALTLKALAATPPSPNSLLYFNGTNFSSTSSPNVGYINATSTTATSTFQGAINYKGTITATSTVVCVAPEVCQYQADGTDDNVTIQSAETEAHNSSGGVVLIKKGAYTLTNAINLFSSTTIIMESGTFLNQTTSAKNVFSANGSSGNEVTHLIITGGRIKTVCTPAVSNTGIQFNYVNYSTIDNVEVDCSDPAGIYLINSNYNTVQNNKVHDVVLHGIIVKAAHDNKILNNYVYNVATCGGCRGQGIYLYDGSADNNLVKGNYIYNVSETGIRVEGSKNIIDGNNVRTVGRSAFKEEVFGSTKPVGGNHDNQVINNTFTDVNEENGGHAAIWIQDYDSTVSNNIIYNSGTYDSATDAIVIDGRNVVADGNSITGFSTGILSEQIGSTITGNHIQFSYANGIWLSASQTGTNFGKDVNGGVISGNTIMNSSLTTPGSLSGIRISASGSGTTATKNSIIGNISSDNQTSMATVLTTAAKIGDSIITVASTSEKVTSDTDLVSPSWGFVKGMTIALVDGATTENVVISSVDSETQLTLTTTLVNAYATSSTVTGVASQKYGVAFVASSGGSVDDNLVSGNTMVGNTTSAMEVSADQNVRIGLNNTGGTTAEQQSSTTFIGRVGISTSTPGWPLSVNGIVAAASFIGTTTATSTLGGGLSISSGCFRLASGLCTASYDNTILSPNVFTYWNGSSLQSSSSPTISYLYSTTTSTSTFVGGLQADYLNISSTTATSTFQSGLQVGVSPITGYSFTVKDSGTTLGQIGLQGGTNVFRIGYVNGLSTAQFGPTTNNGMSLLSNGIARMTILNAGNIGIATTTSQWPLEILSASGCQLDLFDSISNHWCMRSSRDGIFYLGTSSPTSFATNTPSILSIDSKGHFIYGGPKPACDANCTFIAGNDNAFRVTLGVAVTTSTITFANSWGNPSPICSANEGSGGSVTVNASSTPTTVVLTALSALSSVDIEVQCVGITP